MKKSLVSLVFALLLVAPSWAEDPSTLPPGEVSPSTDRQISTDTEGVSIKSLEVTGVTVLPNEKVQELLRLVPGQRYQRAVLEEDLQKIRDLYDGEVWVLEDIDCRLEPDSGKLTVHILETVVENITVIGTAKPDTERRVRPNMRTRIGSVLNRRRYGKDLERLRNIGYFHTVVAEIRRGAERGKVEIVLQVEESNIGLPWPSPTP